MKKKLVVILIIILIILGAYFWHQAHKPKKIIPSITVTQRTIKQKAIAVGNVVPKNQMIVKSSISGTVDQLYHHMGDFVAKNTPLLRLDPNPDPNTLAQQIGKVAQDKATYLAAQKQLKGYQFLLQKNLILANNSDYITALKTVATSQAQLKYDQQYLDLLQKGEATIGGKLVRNIVYAPTSGFILDRYVDVGDSVVNISGYQAATPLFSIANMNDLIFQGSVDETDSNKIKVGMTATITLGALPNQKITGTLTQVALQSDAENAKYDPTASVTQSATATNTSPFNVGFQVKITHLVIPKTISLRSGFSATASIVVAEAKNTLAVPERVLVFKNNKTYVRLQTANGKPKLQAIKTGISDGLYIQVVSGLKVGQKVLEDNSAS